MKSSGAVFSRQNPFPPDPPLSKTHYNPSRAKTLPRPERRTALSPVRLSRPPSPPPPPDTLSPADERFLLAASNRLLPAGPPAADPQPSFSESWPSTDLGSPQGADCAPSPGADAPPPAAPAGKPQAWAGPVGPREDSVLARYVERFRRGRPQSREERRRSAASEGEGARFWWLPASPPSSSPSALTSEKGSSTARRAARSLSPSPPSPAARSRLSPPVSPPRAALDLSPAALSDGSPRDPRDPEILRLQERARRLVQRSETSLSSSSIPVSSEGLGTLDSSSRFSMDEPVRRPTVPSLLDPTTGLVTLAPLPRPSAGGRPRPEDDILFQWRLRRKMELARERPLLVPQDILPTDRMQESHSFRPAVTSQRGAPHLDASPRESRGPGSPTPAPPSFPVASPALIASHPPPGHGPPDVPAHLHLLCDILPCPLQPPHPAPGSPPAADPPPSAEPPPPPGRGSKGSSQSPPGVGTKEAGAAGASRPERRASGQGRESASASARRARDSHKPRGPAQAQRGGPGSRREAAPASPVHSALGQVVSEVLFSPPNSPPGSQRSQTPDPQRDAPSSLPESSTPAPGEPQPSEVVAQLLQDAEDSDGLEFEDDPLLQVLRWQREQVIEQLRVDELLHEVQEESHSH
ncbi:proline and serine-rich protein 3 isoform X2 [Lepisosteus oculatus]|uniref:proline and serine-rich protein 3 isoform X2 n=1 Tax=Lepisosteus oculatus TaxID=7918 RepID=UPI0037207395